MVKKIQKQPFSVANENIYTSKKKRKEKNECILSSISVIVQSVRSISDLLVTYVVL